MNLLAPLVIDSPSSCLVALGNFFVFFMTVGVARNLQFFIEDWVEDFDTTVATAGWVSSCAFAVQPCLGPVTPVVTSFVDQRIVIAVGGAVSAIFFFVASAVDTIVSLIVVVGVAYVGCSFCFVPSCVAVARATREFRPLATGLANLGNTMAALILPYILEAARDAGGGSPFGWRTALRVLGGMFLIVPLFSIFMRPPEIVDDQPPTPPSTTPPKRLLSSTICNFSIFRSSSFLLLLIYFVFHFGAFVSPSIFAAPYVDVNVEETRRFVSNASATPPVTTIFQTGNSSRSAEILSIMGGGDFAGVVVYSLTMNIPHSVVASNRFYFFVFNEVVNVAAAAFVPFASSFQGLAVALFFTGFHFGGWSVVLWTVFADMFGPDVGHATSWALLVGGVSGLATPNILSSVMTSMASDPRRPSSSDFSAIWFGISVSQTIALCLLIVVAFVNKRKSTTTITTTTTDLEVL